VCGLRATRSGVAPWDPLIEERTSSPRSSRLVNTRQAAREMRWVDPCPGRTRLPDRLLVRPAAEAGDENSSPKVQNVRVGSSVISQSHGLGFQMLDINAFHAGLGGLLLDGHMTLHFELHATPPVFILYGHDGSL